MRVGALLATALVTTLLASCSSDQTAATSPSDSLAASDRSAARTYRVESRDLTLVFRLDGSSRASSRVSLGIPSNAVVEDAPSVPRLVQRGQIIGQVVPDERIVAGLSGLAPSSSVAQSQLHALNARRFRLVSPATGRLDRDASGYFIRSVGLDAVVLLSPLQVLRYGGFTFRGTLTVETIFGQRTARCAALWIEPASASSSQATLHCRIPADVETAAGLPLTVTLTAAPMKSVIAVPAIYVGLDARGLNYIVRVHTRTTDETRTIVVGPSDGVVRVVVRGLSAGEVLIPASAGDW